MLNAFRLFFDLHFWNRYITKPGTDGKERLPGDDVAKRLVVAVNDLDGEDESASFEELMKIVVKSGQAKASDVMEMGKKKKSKNNLNGPSTLKIKKLKM